MSKKPRWIWKIYFLIWGALAFVRIDEFFSNASPVNFFYHFLMGVDVAFVIQYSLHALAEISSALMLIPLFLYIYRTPCLSPKFWQWAFMIKLSLDLWFRQYDLLTIHSIAHGGYHITIGNGPIFVPAIYVLIISTLTVVFPAYYAFFSYAFNKNRIMPTHIKQLKNPVPN